MNKVVIVICLFIIVGCKITGKQGNVASKEIPQELIGDFKDDYEITYTINDSVWIQHPGIKYHLLNYNSKGQFFIAKNDAANPGDAGLYTRIDITHFNNMEPFLWGYCLTVYDAKTPEEAVTTASADRNNPKKGCGGYPFSRMKRTE